MIYFKKMISTENNKKLALSIGLSVLFMLVRLFCQNITDSVEKNIFSILIFAFLFFVALKKPSKEAAIYIGAFSLIFSFFIYNGNWQPHTLWSFILLLPFVCLFCFGAASVVEKLDFHAVGGFVGKKMWLVYFIVIMAFWLPVFMTAGPLKISEDSSTVISEALGHLPLSDGNPVLYTIIAAIFLKPFNSVGMIMVGAYTFGLFQICIITAILSYSLFYLQRSGCHKIFVWLGILYFTLTPVFAINAMTVWKDIPYNAVLLLLMIKLYEISKTSGAVLADKKYAFSLACVCVLTCFLRGNGFFIVLGTAVVLVIALKSYRRYLLILFVPLLILVKVIQGPIYNAIGIGGLGAVEAQAMPLQMVARAVIDGAALTEKQEEIINGVMPIEKLKEVYQSSSVDFIKYSEHFNHEYFSSHNGEFLKVFLQLAPKNIQSYTSALLGETLGYWKLGFRGQTVLTNENFNGYEGIYYKDIVLKLTGVNGAQWLFDRTEFISLGFFAFLTLFTAFYHASHKRYLYIIPLLPLLFTWLGLMIGAPTYCDFRYMLVFPYALPFSLFLLFNKPTSTEKNDAFFTVASGGRALK